jgi:DNA-binding transcriptional ArsR family regulator
VRTTVSGASTRARHLILSGSNLFSVTALLQLEHQANRAWLRSAGAPTTKADHDRLDAHLVRCLLSLPAVLTMTLVSATLPLVATDRERDVWTALGDGTRRAIVLMLAAGPMSVGDLAAQLPVTRPAVSQHLKVLKDAGLVNEEAIGTRRIYRLDAAGVAALREQLDDFWIRALGGFRNVVERSRRSKK